MKPTILVATDFSENARPAAQWAERFAKTGGYRIVAVHVTEINFANWASGAYDLLENTELHQQAEERIGQWYEEAVGRRPDAVDVRVGHPEVQITEAVAEHDPAYLVVARSGKNALQKFWLGSTAQSLANDPPCRMFIVHPDHDTMDLGQIAVGTDFSPNSEVALETAAELAGELETRLEIIHATEEPALESFGPDEPPEHFDRETLNGKAADRMDELLAKHGESLQAIEHDSHILDADPARGIIEFVQKHGIDLLVVGRTGHSQFAAPVLGSVLSKLVHYVDSTVLITPSIDEPEA